MRLSRRKRPRQQRERRHPAAAGWAAEFLRASRL